MQKKWQKAMSVGLRLRTFHDIKEGDIIEAYVMEEIKRV